MSWKVIEKTNCKKSNGTINYKNKYLIENNEGIQRFVLQWEDKPCIIYNKEYDELISKYNEFYCLDSVITRVYNAIMYSKQIKSKYLKIYINLMLENIRKQKYTESPLHITGPGLLGKIIKNSDIKIYYSLIGYMNGYICDIQSDIKYFSTNYSVEQYYRGKGNYLNTTHYGILWKKFDVYTNEKVEEFTLD